MFTHDITAAALDAVEPHAAPGKPVYMLNLLRFRAQARYADPSFATPCTGREAFHERYVPAFRRLAGGAGATRLFIGPLLGPIVAPEGERWDVVALNEYADFATFRQIVGSAAYRGQVQPHRLAALEDFRLLALDRAM